MVDLRSEDGHPALAAAHVQILEYVGSFPERNGCWASDANINSLTLRAKSPKTIRRHLQYLVAIKALTVTKNDKGRIYRLGPAEGPVVTQKDFRVSAGLPEYAYATRKPIVETETMSEEPIDPSWFAEAPKQEKKAAPKEPLFLPKTEEKLAAEKAKDAPEKANFTPILSNTTNSSIKIKQKLPPKVPPRGAEVSEFEDFVRPSATAPVEPSGGSLRDPQVPPNSRRNPSDDRNGGRRDELEIFSISKSENNSDWGAPLYEKKRVKKPKNQAEREAEAKRLSQAGHIVNPRGVVDNRKREVNWKLARDIGPEGAVTIPQLWRFLVKLWTKSFGNSDEIENMLSKDKSALTATFGELKQTFIRLVDYEPSNRDLSEYFEWFLEPKRLASILESGKYSDPSNPKSTLHFRQMTGSVFVARFFQEVIVKRRQEQAKAADAEVSVADQNVSALDQRFNHLRRTCDDNSEFVFAMVENGYALTVQFLHDEKQIDESLCKQRIINTMVDLLRKNKTKQAVEYLKTGIKNTERLSNLLRKETCIWFDWQEKTKDLIAIAIEQSGVNIE